MNVSCNCFIVLKKCVYVFWIIIVLSVLLSMIMSVLNWNSIEKCLFFSVNLNMIVVLFSIILIRVNRFICVFVLCI